MAGAGRKVFTRERLTSADVNSYLMDQTVMRFASASARTTQLPSPSLGMHSFLDDVKRTEVFNGATWVPIGGQGLAFCFARATSLGAEKQPGWANIPMAVASTDTHGMFNPSNPEVLTVPANQGGLYRLSGASIFSEFTTAHAENARIRVNNTTLEAFTHGRISYGQGTARGGGVEVAPRLLELAAGHIISIQSYADVVYRTDAQVEGASSFIIAERVR